MVLKTMLEPIYPGRVSDSFVGRIFDSNVDKLEDDMEVDTFAHGVRLAAYCGCPIAALPKFQYFDRPRCESPKTRLLAVRIAILRSPYLNHSKSAFARHDSPKRMAACTKSAAPSKAG